MKKLPLFIALLAVASVAITSCKKEYNCTCTRTDSSGGTRVDQTTIMSTEKHAQRDCDASVPDSDFGKVCVLE